MASTSVAVAAPVNGGTRAVGVSTTDRARAFALWNDGGRATRAAAAKALAGSDADVAAFLGTGQQTVVAEDNRVRVLQMLDGAGRGVTEAGQRALNGTAADVEELPDRSPARARPARAGRGHSLSPPPLGRPRG
ncbi:ALF repeat-containing protein [Saccharothrix sp. ST-888]|uniref:ALF repeat-containing protein n=1 Tax=Saccharothrix sp. ST-888 TaxID=1427391 RepID=UPI0005EC40E2|nr:ALF repeat-containing protein [Saccharothrix sp. ST-888]KJK57431.1 hypothetical protein UK12_16640 [Saccharothrix sp. ST-888]